MSIKEYHSTNYHHEYELLQKPHNYKKELSKRRRDGRNSKRSNISEGKKLQSKGGLTKSLSDHNFNSLMEKEEFPTSEVTERNESTYIALERVLENNFHHMRFSSLSKNVTDSRTFRRKKSKQQREVVVDAGKETDSDKTLNICRWG